MPAETYEATFGSMNDTELGLVFDIAPHLNGTVKPYDVCCFMLNLPKSGQDFDFRSARVTVRGDTGDMSHHFFLNKELMPSQDKVAETLRQVYTEISGVHFAELDSNSALAADTTAGHDLKVLNHEVIRMLNSEWPQQKNTSLLDTWKRRDKLMRQIG